MQRLLTNFLVTFVYYTINVKAQNQLYVTGYQLTKRKARLDNLKLLKGSITFPSGAMWLMNPSGFYGVSEAIEPLTYAATF